MKNANSECPVESMESGGHVTIDRNQAPSATTRLLWSLHSQSLQDTPNAYAKTYPGTPLQGAALFLASIP